MLEEMELDMEVSLKVIVVGNGMVGKTSLITRYATGRMTDTYKKTIGTDFMEKTIELSGEQVKLMLWDTAGQEMFSKLTRSYYKGSGAVIYVFSTVDRASFDEVARWKARVESEVGDVVAVLVQNKIDLYNPSLPPDDARQIHATEAEELARRLRLPLYRTCVKDNVLVDEVFRYISERYVEGGGGSSWMGGESVAQISELTVKDDVGGGGGSGGGGGGGGMAERIEEEGAGVAGAGGHTDASVETTVRDNGSDRSDSVHSDDSNASASPATAATAVKTKEEERAARKAEKKAKRQTAQGNGGFQLKPLTQRTNGKKKSSIAQLCTIL